MRIPWFRCRARRKRCTFCYLRCVAHDLIGKYMSELFISVERACISLHLLLHDNSQCASLPPELIACIRYHMETPRDGSLALPDVKIMTGASSTYCSPADATVWYLIRVVITNSHLAQVLHSKAFQNISVQTLRETHAHGDSVRCDRSGGSKLLGADDPHRPPKY